MSATSSTPNPDSSGIQELQLARGGQVGSGAWWKGFVAALVLGVVAFLVGRYAFGLVRATTPAAVFWSFFGLIAMGYFITSLVRAALYRPIAPPRDDTKLPRVALIVPAYNEGAMVRVALESALASDYPRGLLVVLGVDDGSKDDTWSHIAAVAEASDGRVVAIKQPQNGGKREALRTGFVQAGALRWPDGVRCAADVVVTVDSDSKLSRRAVRNIVAPIAARSDVAAVAGRVTVLNREDGWLTRLLSARFFVTFDLARASQSMSGAVLCTPGALSAYRLSAVERVLAQWSSQTFFGAPCTIAEDRALTTWLLRDGWRSVYQSTAEVATIMPTTLPRLGRMLVRWERGNIREDLVMLPMLLTRWRTRDRWWPTFEVVFELVSYPVAYVGLALLVAELVQRPAQVVSFGSVILLSSAVQSLWCLRSPRGSDFVWGMGYALFAFIGLQWVFPYSLLTVRDGRWLTR